MPDEQKLARQIASFTLEMLELSGDPSKQLDAIPQLSAHQVGWQHERE